MNMRSETIKILEKDIGSKVFDTGLGDYYLNLTPKTKAAAAAAAKSLQSCPTLCEPIDGSPPGSPIPGIMLQDKANKNCLGAKICLER